MSELKLELIKTITESDISEAELRNLTCAIAGHIKGSSGKCSCCGVQL